MTNQRAHERYTLWFPIRVENPSGKIEAMARDGSAGGILISGRDGANALEVGESVFVQLPEGFAAADEEALFGRVVRIDELPGGDRRIAIEFIRPVPELERLFKTTSSRPPPP